MSHNTISVGRKITLPAFRDAIHIAVTPIEAAEWLAPGQSVRIAESGKAVAAPRGGGCGVVDPFLPEHVTIGERFWLFMNPYSITSLRHAWTHPALKDEPVQSSDRAQAEKWLRNFAESWEMDFEQLVTEAAKAGEVCAGTECYGRDDIGEQQWAAFWQAMEIYTGEQYSETHRDNTSFRCAC